jgi:DNA repair exonuclease SbcCD ATPase subunit
MGFEKDVNVIVGVNGAGKSSLLDAIALALLLLTL